MFNFTYRYNPINKCLPYIIVCEVLYWGKQGKRCLQIWKTGFEPETRLPQPGCLCCCNNNPGLSWENRFNLVETGLTMGWIKSFFFKQEFWLNSCLLIGWNTGLLGWSTGFVRPEYRFHKAGIQTFGGYWRYDEDGHQFWIDLKQQLNCFYEDQCNNEVVLSLCQLNGAEEGKFVILF